MRSDFLPFSKPTITADDIRAVTDVMLSGWITTGQKSAELEQKFCEYLGCRGALALASATGAMHLLLKALDIGPGDEVITPAMTWVSTVNLIVLSGAKPVFVDVDRQTLMTSAEMVKPCVSNRTRLIVPVHFAGATVDLEAMRQLAADHDIVLVEDAAHALGAFYKEAPVGRQGTAIFSFHPIKNITTGEGGMFCSDNEALLSRIRRLKFHGLGIDSFDRHTQGRSPQAEVLEPGFKYNMTDLSAALGISQFERLQDFNRRRRKLAGYYLDKLAGIEEIMPLAQPAYPIEHAWHLFIIRLDTDKASLNRDEFMAALKDRNIGTGLHFRAVHLQKYYRAKIGTQPGMLPNTEWNSDRICSLPLFPAMTREDIDDVVDAIKDVLSK